MIAAWLALACALAADPVAELAHLEAAAAAAPESAAAQFALGTHLTRFHASPDAIPVLRRALALGLAGPDADWARLYVALLLDEAGRDTEAVVECRALLAAWPAEHPLRKNAMELLSTIAARHAALDGVTAAETRAIIAVVLAMLSVLGGFLAGRRLAGGSAA